MSFGPLKKPTMAHLTLMNWMYNHPELRMVVLSDYSHTSCHWAYADGKRYRYRGDDWTHMEEGDKDWNNEEAPKIPKSTAFHRMSASEWIENRKLKGESVWNKASRYRLTDKGREVVEEYAEAYAAHLDKLEKARAKVDRLIIVRNTGRYGETRRYAALCRVVKETAKRVYVERVYPDGKPPRSGSWVPSIEGRRGNEYVKREDISMDGVTVEEYLAVRHAENAHRAWLKELKAQEDAELDLIRERFKQRREQGGYAFEDEVREALAGLKQ